MDIVTATTTAMSMSMTMTILTRMTTDMATRTTPLMRREATRPGC
jgi:hypothetical protein